MIIVYIFLDALDDPAQSEFHVPLQLFSLSLSRAPSIFSWPISSTKQCSVLISLSEVFTLHHLSLLSAKFYTHVLWFVNFLLEK